MTQDPEDLRLLDALGRAVPQVAPPAELRARVLSAATAQPSASRTSTPTATTPPATAPPARAVRRTLAPWLATAAAALIAIGASAGWLSARGENARLRSIIADLRASTTSLLAIRDDLQREKNEGERASAILSAGDVTQTALAGVGPAGAARARVYVSPSRGLLFAAEELPALPADRAYQLWTIVAGQPVSNGIVELDMNGRAQLLAVAPPGRPDAFAVTVEPAGGMPSPTGTRVLLGAPAS